MGVNLQGVNFVINPWWIMGKRETPPRDSPDSQSKLFLIMLIMLHTFYKGNIKLTPLLSEG